MKNNNANLQRKGGVKLQKINDRGIIELYWKPKSIVELSQPRAFQGDQAQPFAASPRCLKGESKFEN